MQVVLSLAQSHVAQSAELQARVTITNRDKTPARLNTLYFFPSVVLHVRDAAGKPVPAGPPPVPPNDDGQAARKTLAPGESYRFEIAGASLLPTPLAPGKYEMRFDFTAASSGGTHDWEGPLRSDWVPFTVGR